MASGLMKLSGFAAIVLSFWAAIITGFMVGPSLIILIHLDSYRPAVFKVEKIMHVKGVQGSKRTYDKSWLEGTIEGEKEKFYRMGDYVKGPINRLEDMEAQVKVGQELPVMFSPAMAPHMEERILYPDKDFRVAREKTLNKMLYTAYYPLGLCLGACLLFGLMAGKVKAAIGFFFGSMFMVAFSWVPTLLRLV